ncbi:MAG: hypothetical protein IJD42_08050 [Clostridia bacterium]|nr:hypothetical protein [Clostridia bacterium]
MRKKKKKKIACADFLKSLFVFLLIQAFLVSLLCTTLSYEEYPTTKVETVVVERVEREHDFYKTRTRIYSNHGVYRFCDLINRWDQPYTPVELRNMLKKGDEITIGSYQTKDGEHIIVSLYKDGEAMHTAENYAKAVRRNDVLGWIIVGIVGPIHLVIHGFLLYIEISLLVPSSKKKRRKKIKDD